jgi:hypothetical protein
VLRPAAEVPRSSATGSRTPTPTTSVAAGDRVQDGRGARRARSDSPAGARPARGSDAGAPRSSSRSGTPTRRSVPSAEAVIGALTRPETWPDYASEIGRFTPLRPGGLPDQTFEIEVAAGCGVDWATELDAHVARIEAQVERYAPGFRDRILARHVLGPADLERRDRNLVGGDVGGGSYRLDQVLFRPVPSLSPYRTPVAGLYLGSAAHVPRRSGARRARRRRGEATPDGARRNDPSTRLIGVRRCPAPRLRRATGRLRVGGGRARSGRARRGWRGAASAGCARGGTRRCVPIGRAGRRSRRWCGRGR